MENIGSCDNTTILPVEFYPMKAAELDAITLSQVELGDEMPFTDGILNSTATDNEDVIVSTTSETELYCRVCGLQNSRSDLEGIFGEDGEKQELQTKISKHLNLQVEKDDKLPQQVCNSCICQLNICHRLSLISHAADVKLRQLFLHSSKGNEEMSNKNTLDLVSEQDSADSNSSKSQTEVVEIKDKPVKPEKKNPSLSLLCYVCGKDFKSPKHLREHKRSHSSDSEKKKYQCSVCAKYFRSKLLLSEHTNVHTGSTPYSCADCGKAFHKRVQLKQHAQTHSGDDTRVACSICNMNFARRANLQAHMKVHATDRTFSCRLCHQQFPTVGAMLSHRRQHSQDDVEVQLLRGNVKAFTCEVCGKIFTNRDSLSNHQGQHSEDGSTRHECGDCGKVLRSRRSLEYHQRSQHSARRSFLCSLCPQGFMSEKLLRAHQCKHTGDKPFKCEICWSGFRSRSNLMQHMLKHQNEKNFECPVCNKRFRRKGALKTHNRSHTGERPFICDICGRPFRQKNDMLKHQRSHTDPNSRNRTCDLCPAVFVSNKQLVKHKETAHKEFVVQMISESALNEEENVNVVPLIIAQNVFETHIITEDGQELVFEAMEIVRNDLPIPSSSS